MLKDIDMPKAHLLGVEDYWTPRTRDENKAQQRRELHHIHKDLVVLGGQAKGLGSAIVTLETVQEPEDIAFAVEQITQSGINSGWYTASRDADEMRKRWKLPLLVPTYANQRPGPEELFERGMLRLRGAYELAQELPEVLSDPLQQESAELLKLHFGQSIGNACLNLVCMPLAEAIKAEPKMPSHHAVQRMVRKVCLATFDQARMSGEAIGKARSLAQFADIDSPQSVYWRQHAPEGAFVALNEAQAKLPSAA